MTGLVLFSHGSVLCGAGAALDAHADRLRRDYSFPLVEVGYLNYSEPPFADAVRRLAGAGANEIVVVPFFLAPGYFVSHSLPKCVDSVRPDYPGVSFIIAEPLGADPLLADALLESAVGAKSGEHWRAGLAQALASCRMNPQCPLHSPSSPGSVSLSGEKGSSASCRAGSPLSTPRERGLGGEGDAGGVRSSPLSCGSGGGVGGGGIKGAGPTALLVMVHGSPKPEANEEMYHVVELVRKRGAFSIVEIGFMECNQPTISEAIEACLAQGADTIVAVPYFLHMGAHVAEDLPTLLEEAQARRPNTTFLMGEYIGRSVKITDLLANRARAALNLQKEKQHAR